VLLLELWLRLQLTQCAGWGRGDLPGLPPAEVLPWAALCSTYQGLGDVWTGESGTDGTQLGLEGAHCGTVAVSPTPRADADPNLLFSRLDGESNVAEHEAVALEALEVMTTSRIVNVEEHCAGV
jgi:hypothetical protein